TSFNACSNYSWGETEDYTLNITPAPNCLPPTASSSANATQNSVNLSWTGVGSSFDIKWGTIGFNIETEGTVVENFTNGGTLSGLTAATSYQFYVRQNCGSDVSPWSASSYFTTLCEIPDAPTAITFTSVTPTATTINYTAPGVAPTG